MAMNKKEQAEMERLKLECGMARTVIFRTEPLPKPMGRHDGDFRTVTVGWWFNEYTKEVGQGCFNQIHQSTRSTTKTDRQDTGRFYATREDALIVLRHEMARTYAKYLANIDAEIEGERQS